MATIEQLEQALLKAHRAGDERAAKLISGRIQSSNADTYMGANSDDATFGEKVVGGLKHAWDKAAYGLEGAVKGALGQGITKEHKQHLEQGKAFVNKAGGAAKVAEFAGDILPYAATAMATGGASLPMAMAAQGLTGAVVTPESFGERLKSGALAAGGEGAGHLLMKSLGRLAGGVKDIDPAAQRMIDEGIFPTYGGLKGGRAKAIEDRLMSTPFIGGGIGAGRRGAIEEANLASMRRGGIPDDVVTEAGFGGQQQLNDYFEKQFGDALQGVRFDLTDPALQKAIDNAALTGNLPLDKIDDLNRFFANERNIRGLQAQQPGTGVSTVINPNPSVPSYISGQDFHGILQKIRKESADYRYSPDPDQKKYGQAMRSMYDEMQNLARQQGASDKGALDAFDLARRQYASVAPAMRAGELSRVAGQQGGIFTPRQYANANVANMKNMGQRAQLRTGQGYNQQFGEDMVKALGENYPDSGTATRAMYGAIAMAPQAFLSPSSLVLNPMLMGASHLMNSPTGRRYLAGALPGQQALASQLRSYAPQAGAAGAALIAPFGSDY